VKSSFIFKLTIILLAVMLSSCRAGRDTTGNRSEQQETAATEVLEEVTGIETGAGNTALGSIMGNRLGGEAGEYIKNRMEEMAEKIQEELPAADVVQVGEGINLALDESEKDLFNEDQLKLTSAAKQDLEKLASVLKEYRKTNIVIEGHTDDQGNSSYNLTLSRHFTEAAADHLREQGVSQGRRTTSGEGEGKTKEEKNGKEKIEEYLRTHPDERFRKNTLKELMDDVELSDGYWGQVLRQLEEEGKLRSFPSESKVYEWDAPIDETVDEPGSHIARSIIRGLSPKIWRGG
jgi:outer membrane protein OmpA-like peptidoglycan-associated protein